MSAAAAAAAATVSDKRALGERLPQHRALKGARYYCRPVVGTIDPRYRSALTRRDGRNWRLPPRQ